MQHRTFQKKSGGYTIIETMIATSLFIIIVTAGLGALLNANLLHQKSQSMRSVIDNLSFIMEDISRNIKTGYNYHCFTLSDTIPFTTSSIPSTPKSCTSGWAIAFETDQGSASNLNDQWVYYINNGKVFKATTGPYSPGSFVQLTPDEVVIDPASSFAVLGAEPPPLDTQEPFVTLHLAGTITFKNVTTPFSLETSASQRLLDI